jgi:hypothetical protein
MSSVLNTVVAVYYRNAYQLSYYPHYKRIAVVLFEIFEGKRLGRNTTKS